MGCHVTLRTYVLAAKWRTQTGGILRTSDVLASVLAYDFIIRPHRAAFEMSARTPLLRTLQINGGCSVVFLSDKANRKVFLREDGAWPECFEPNRLLVLITNVFSLWHKVNLCSHRTHPSYPITSP
jgi:hypothetical protein